MLQKLCSTTNDIYASLGLLLLRTGSGAVMLGAHGLGKLMEYGAKSGSFPDPLGVGSPVSLALAIFAEFFCALLLVLGFCTRLAAIPLIITMGVAVFIIHADDPWHKKELAVLYLVCFSALLFTGAGKFSIDATRKPK